MSIIQIIVIAAFIFEALGLLVAIYKTIGIILFRKLTEEKVGKILSKKLQLRGDEMLAQSQEEQLLKEVAQRLEAVQQSENAAQQLNEVIQKIRDVIEKTRRVVQRQENATQQLNKVIQKIRDVIEKIRRVVRRQENATQQLNEAIQQLNEAVQQLDGAVRQSENATQQLNEVIQKIRDAIEKTRKAIQLTKEKKFTSRTFQHYKVSRAFLLRVYSADKEYLKFADRYQMRWDNIRNRWAALIGSMVASITTIIAFFQNIYPNIAILNFVKNVLSKVSEYFNLFNLTLYDINLTLYDLKAFIALIIIYGVIILLNIIVWKLGDDGFYDKIIKEILEENGESSAAE